MKSAGVFGAEPSTEHEHYSPQVAVAPRLLLNSLPFAVLDLSFLPDDQIQWKFRWERVVVEVDLWNSKQWERKSRAALHKGWGLALVSPFSLFNSQKLYLQFTVYVKLWNGFFTYQAIASIKVTYARCWKVALDLNFVTMQLLIIFSDFVLNSLQLWLLFYYPRPKPVK